MRRGALVLCGGKSARMGRDKAWLEFGSETLLQRVVRRLRGAVEDIVVVGRALAELPALPPSVGAAPDVHPGLGPLGGLLTGLRVTPADAVFATGCDVPFLRRGVVDLLFESLGGHAIAVAEVDAFVHPLCAVYRREVLAEVERLVESGRLRPVYLYDTVPTLRVPERDLRRVDPTLASLESCNTPDDYAAARARWRAGEGRVVRVELFDAARALAGIDAVEVDAGTLGEALAATASRCPALGPRVIVDGRLAPHWRASLNGRRFVEDPTTPLEDGDAVILVSALAGG